MNKHPNLLRFDERPYRKTRLFCFPHLGGSAECFRPLAFEAPDEMEVWGIEPPGHGSLLSEASFREMALLAEQLRGQIASLTGDPYAFFGHGVGALVAFETLRGLRREGLPLPSVLFASGCPSPRSFLKNDLHETGMEPLETTVFEILRLLNFQGTEQFACHSTAKILMRTFLLSDWEIFARYRYFPEEPFPLPFVVIEGEDDPTTHSASQEGWQFETQRRLRSYRVSGDHYFPYHSSAQVLEVIAKNLLSEKRNRTNFQPTQGGLFMQNQEFRSPVILSVATHVPPNPVSTEELLGAFGPRISDDLKSSIEHLEIENRYSLVEDFPRYLVGEKERRLLSTTTEIAIESVRKCLEASETDPKKIGMLIVTTNTANRPLPCTAYEILEKLGHQLPHDINVLNMQNQGCSVLPKMCEIAGYYLQANPGRTVLIAAAEGHTGLLGQHLASNYYGFHEQDRLSPQEAAQTQEVLESFLFGDGAVAVLLGNRPSGIHVGPFSHLTNHDKEDSELLHMDEGGILVPSHSSFPHYSMSPKVPHRGLFYAEKCVSKLLEETRPLLSEANDAETFLIHTGSKKILDGVCSALGPGPRSERVQDCYEVLKNHANLSSASVGFILAKSLEKKKVGTGLMITFGVGFSASAGLIHHH